MYIAYTEEQEALRRDLRAYYDELLTPEVQAVIAKSEGVGPESRAIVRRMGEDGWLGIGWPTEYGGQGRGHIDQFLFFISHWGHRCTISQVGHQIGHCGLILGPTGVEQLGHGSFRC